MGIKRPNTSRMGQRDYVRPNRIGKALNEVKYELRHLLLLIYISRSGLVRSAVSADLAGKRTTTFYIGRPINKVI